MNLETLKIDLFKKGITKINEGNFEEAKVLFDAARTANELSATCSLQSNETNIESIKNDVAREVPQAEKDSNKSESNKKDKKDKKENKDKKEKKSTKKETVEDWESLEPVDTEEEEEDDVPVIGSEEEPVEDIADTPDEFVADEEDEEDASEPEKVYAKDENGNDIDITYEYELLDGLKDKHRKAGALKLVSNNCVEIYEKLDQLSNFKDKIKKIKVAAIIGSHGIKKCNKKVSDITSGLNTNIYEWINDENVDVFLKKK